MAKIKLALIGFGYWGPNLLRNLMQNVQCEVVGVVDQSPEKLAKCKGLYPQLKIFASGEEMLSAAKPDGVVIATPPPSHYDLTKYFLNKNCHVFVEKPLTFSSLECDELIAIADHKQKVILVDHTFCYTPEVRYLKDYFDQGKLGDLLFYDSVRINLGGFQPETNILWDLGPHDISIMDALTGGLIPKSVAATGVAHFDKDVENMCYLSMFYDNDIVAHCHLNWAAPVKSRRIMVSGTRKMLIYDDNNPVEKIKIYDKGLSVRMTESDYRINYRSGDMVAPAIPQREALGAVVQEFIDCITTGRQPLTNGLAGKRVVQVLEAASQSMELGGTRVTINESRRSQLQSA